MRVLLDTHALIWHSEDSPRLSLAAVEAIESPENNRFFSVASIWEMAVKINAGKLELSLPLRDLIRYYADSGVVMLPVAEKYAVASIGLERKHGDPFDRMLVVQATIESLTVVTCDPLIVQYGVECIW